MYIYTDQDPWLTGAIVMGIPITKHLFSIWHITVKFSAKLYMILRDENQNWLDFFKLYKLTSPKEFEHY